MRSLALLIASLATAASLVALGGSRRPLAAGKAAAAAQAPLTAAATGTPQGPAADLVWSAPVSGVVVERVAFATDPQRPYLIDRIELHFAGRAGPRTLRVRLSPGGPWYACHAADGLAACPTPGATVATALALEIVAA